MLGLSGISPLPSPQCFDAGIAECIIRVPYKRREQGHGPECVLGNAGHYSLSGRIEMWDGDHSASRHVARGMGTLHSWLLFSGPGCGRSVL